MSKLDKEEQDLLDSYERGEWQSVENIETEIERYRKLARATLESSKDNPKDSEQPC
jgi:hypothetical protein